MSDKTIGQAILEAHEAMETAEQRRNVLLTIARQNGVTLRTLGMLLGVAPSTVMRWTDDGETGQPDSDFLDWPISHAGCLPGDQA